MDSDAFINDWKEKFPGVKPPNVKFSSLEEASESLAECKALIKTLEENLNQEKFHLIFLQTYLASKKRAHIGDKFGYSRSKSSSVDSEQDMQSPVPENEARTDLVPDALNAVYEQSNGKENINTSPENHEVTNVAKAFVPVAKPLVKLREGSSEEKSSANRLSKVLENVKMFEAQAKTDPNDGGASNSSFDTTSTFPPRSSLRGKRSSYLQVWECQTGADKEKASSSSKFAVKHDAPQSEELNSEQSEIAKEKRPNPEPRRNNYVEVWTCNTGNQMSMDMYQDDESTHDMSPSLTMNDDDDIGTEQDYDLEDIDMKDGYGKRHYTMAGSDVKLRSTSAGRIDQMTNRMTWPAAAGSLENPKDGMMDGELENAESIDLSDLDNEHSTDSQHSDGSRHDSLDSFPDNNQNATGKSSAFSETSPLHNLRRARTTNERMSVAYSAFSGWSDDDRLVERSSMLSIQSNEYSDEDHEPIEESVEVTDTSGKSDMGTGSTGSPVFHKPKQDAGEDSNHSPSPTISITTAPDESQESVKNEAVSDMVDYQKVRSIAEAEKLRMRRWVLSSVLDNEEAYLQYLNTLLLYMKPLKATIGTSQPVMSAQDFDTVFFRVPELHSLHATFYQKLKPKLEVWSADTTVGDQFKKLLSKLSLYGDYLNNYKRAQHTVEKCAKENAQFAQIIERMKVQSRGSKDSESISLIEVLYKPVERVMRTTLVLQDLLKHTPHRHPDYHVLRQVLKQAQGFLERINSTSSSSYKPRRVPSSAAAAARSADRELVKDGFLVEVASDGSRKLRHCFLYNDLLLCTKLKSAAGVFHSKDSYECKWYIPLADLSFHPKEDSEAIPDVPSTSEEELREMSNRAQQTKRDIARERKRNKREHRGSPVRSRQEERLRKKLGELEGRIILAAPDLPLRIYHMQGKERNKSYMLLMSSDYERVEWTEAIMKQQETCFKSFSLTSLEVNALLSACVRLRKMNNVGSMMIKEDEDLLSGYLNVTIHSGQGFLRACNPYCTLEVDSFGQFQTKAKTRPCRDTDQPVWDEEFEIDLDGAQTLRILCYDRARDASAGAGYDDDVLIAKGKVGLMQESLRARGEWKEECVLMNEISIRVSVKFIPREHSLQRLPSKKANGTFGVKIDVVAKRESSGIPGIVKKCIAEVERRGMNEVGIYRVSGVASEIQALKASFDTNRKDVTMLLGEVDINAVAGVLKLYFRELPEPLYTDARYNAFVEASALTDPETKDRTIVRLLYDLPTANYKTLHFLREHLVKVAKNEIVNKMNLHNLATVFGPTLLRPAEDKTASLMSPTAGMLNALRLDVHYQMDVLLNCLEMDNLPSYEAMKSGGVTQSKRPLSQSSENLLSQSQTESSSEKSKGSLVRSATVDSTGSSISARTVVPAPSNVQRYHPYEEITIGQFKQQQSVKPPVGRKPSSGPKPKPAPRKSSLMRQSQPVVTDL